MGWKWLYLSGSGGDGVNFLQSSLCFGAMCFEFVAKTALIRHSFFGYCWAVLAQLTKGIFPVLHRVMLSSKPKGGGELLAGSHEATAWRRAGYQSAWGRWWASAICITFVFFPLFSLTKLSLSSSVIFLLSLFLFSPRYHWEGEMNRLCGA